MTFEDLVAQILTAEQAADGRRLRDWLHQQGTWLWDRSYEIDDPELRGHYLALRGLVEGLLWPSPVIAAAPDGAPGPGLLDDDTDRPTATRPTSTLNAVSHPPPPAADPQPAAAPGPPPPGQLVADELQRLWQDTQSGGESAEYAAAYQACGPALPEEDPAERSRRLWTWLHLVCLRLPRPAADELRARARAVAAKAVPAAEQERPPHDYLIPPLEIANYPGDDTGVALDGALGDPADDAEVASILGIATQITWLARHDPAVMAGYHIVNPASKLALFTPNGRKTYDRYMSTRLEAPQSREVDSLVRLDELIRGVVPMPLPALGSWWRARLAESGRILTDLFDQGVTIPATGSPYQQLLDEDVAESGYAPVPPQDAPGVAPDTVAWVLRVRSPGNKSRVVYVSGT